MDKLAIFGGKKVINYTYDRYNSISKEEKEAVNKVMETGVLSNYIGADCDEFLGGPNVRKLEKLASDYFGVKYAISVNSWTSGLTIAMGAIGISPGDEVITTSWTMSATAAAVIQWNAIPIFCDIDEHTFCIDHRKIRELITSKTKAIIAVDIYGQSANMTKMMEIAEENNLMVISDTAQSPGAKHNDVYAGTLAHIGGYSLNYHKHINCGEGGIIVTNDSKLAYRCQLIRNHGEAVVGPNNKDIINIIGGNYRLGEIECAIAYEQLKKLDSIISNIRVLSERLINGLSEIDELKVPFIPSNNTHVYYVIPLVLKLQSSRIKRGDIVEALRAEGVMVGEGYQILHKLPIYQKRVAYGSEGYPWKSCGVDSNVTYEKVCLPVAEKLHDETLISIPMTMYKFNSNDIDLIVSAFKKVFLNLKEIEEG